MIATCKTCKGEIEVKAWAPMIEGYICPVCQAKYERSFYLHLVRRRIEKMETIDPCPICGSNEGELEDSGMHRNCEDDEY